MKREIPVTLTIVVAVIVLVFVTWNLSRGLLGASRAELASTLSRWKELQLSASQADVERFAQMCPSHIVASNYVFAVGSSKHVSIFAHTKVSTGGTLFVTTNGVFVLLDSTGSVKVLK